jgi:uncharacterized protein
MNVCQMLTGSGGWPLTILLTPDKKPFFAGTYFSKNERFGRIGMMELIPRLTDVWINRREDILKSSNEITEALRNSSLISGSKNLDEKIFEKAFSQLEGRFDSTYGGFGNAPKFPTPHNLLFLLRYWRRYNDEQAIEIVSKTLIEMRKGGIYDHIGFGFHRYSTDRQWLVPHFEKMLYDQALICTAYIEAYQATKNIAFKKTAEEILEYVLRDMTDKNGGFYSAEDADSEGEEGKFYLWTTNEVKGILKENAEFFSDYFKLKEEGNWIDPVHGGLAGTNIPHLKNYLNENDEKRFEKIRKELFEKREERVHPYKDDKILTDWNGLMISAFAKAAQVFENKKYAEAAEKSAEFILNNLRDKNGRLLHRYREGEAGLPAHVDDYAFFIAALLDLYETNFNEKYLKIALDLNEDFLKHFWDEKSGGFFFTSDDGEELIVRQKDIYDGAVPSGNSVAALNLLRLSRITGNTDLEVKASLIGKTFSENIANAPSAFTQFLGALDFAIGPSQEIVIVEGQNSKEEFLKNIREKFNPNKVVLLKNDQLEKFPAT